MKLWLISHRTPSHKIRQEHRDNVVNFFFVSSSLFVHFIEWFSNIFLIEYTNSNKDSCSHVKISYNNLSSPIWFNYFLPQPYDVFVLNWIRFSPIIEQAHIVRCFILNLFYVWCTYRIYRQTREKLDQNSLALISIMHHVKALTKKKKVV